MKATILMASLLMAGLAQAAPISDMKAHLPSGIYHGTENNSTVCSIEVNWISDSEVQVKAVSQYEQDEPDVQSDILFNQPEGAEVFQKKIGKKGRKVVLEQGKTLFQEDDYEVNQVQRVSVLIKSGQLQSIDVEEVQYDGESDPHETITYCTLNK